MCKLYVFRGGTCMGRGSRERRRDERQTVRQRQSYWRETRIRPWTVYAAVAAAVFQIALNSQRLCGINEWMSECMNGRVIFKTTTKVPRKHQCCRQFHCTANARIWRCNVTWYDDVMLSALQICLHFPHREQKAALKQRLLPEQVGFHFVAQRIDVWWDLGAQS